jgi:hypothetical protein
MKTKLARFVLLAYGSIGATHASELIINGGFETGTLSGWTVTTEAGSYAGSNFFASSSTTTPLSGSSTVGPKTGTYYAVSDNVGSSAVILSELFTVPSQPSSLILTYSLFVNSYGGTQINTSAGLDYNQLPSQFGIVSLLSAGTSLFSTSAGVLQNFYLGTAPLAGSNPYVNYSFDITSLVSAGGSYILRFGEVSNLDVLNLGVDNVSVNFTAAVATPEPSSAVLLLFAMAAASFTRCAPKLKTARPGRRTLQSTCKWFMAASYVASGMKDRPFSKCCGEIRNRVTVIGALIGPRTAAADCASL